MIGVFAKTPGSRAGAIAKRFGLIGLAALTIQVCAKSAESPNVAGGVPEPDPALPVFRNLPISIELGTDNGFLKCVAEKFVGHENHGNTTEAFQNLASGATSDDGAVLVGHGSPGLLCTGDGWACGGPSTTVRRSNPNVWTVRAAALRGRRGRLYLMACDTGAGPDGENLLKQLAKATKMEVAAPNAHVWCNASGVTLDPGAVWNIAWPDGRTSFSQRSYTKRAGNGRLFSGGRLETIPEDAIRFSRLRVVVPNPDTATTRAMADAEAQRFGAYIDFSSAFVGPGVPGAVITATLHVSAAWSADRRGEKEFTIYSDDLAEDQENPATFYRIDSRGSEILRAIAR